MNQHKIKARYFPQEELTKSHVGNARLLLLAKRLPFDQIVVYTDRGGNIRWLHVSHKRGERQRGQVLHKRV